MAKKIKENQAPKSNGGNKKMIIIAAALVFLAAAGGGYFFFIGGDGAAKTAVELPDPPIYYDFPKLTVDLKTDRCRSPFLKFQPTIQLSATYLPRLQEEQVKIIDRMTTYLRSQTRSDLMGKEGTEKLRSGVIDIINREIAPAKALAVLFKVFILQ